MLLVYSTAFHTRPALTKCLPAGSDITRNWIQERIAGDVDLSEELDATAIVLIVIQLIVTAVGFTCYRARAGAGTTPGTVVAHRTLNAVATAYDGPTGLPMVSG